MHEAHIRFSTGMDEKFKLVFQNSSSLLSDEILIKQNVSNWKLKNPPPQLQTMH